MTTISELLADVPDSMIGRHTTTSPAETQALAANLAASLPPGTAIALHGTLGAGKTCFVQGLADGLDIRGPVTSPTYTLIQEYEGANGTPPLHHVDLYRLPEIDGRADTRGLGLDDLFFSNGITAVEWPERAPYVLPLPHLAVHFTLDDDKPDERLIEIAVVKTAPVPNGKVSE